MNLNESHSQFLTTFPSTVASLLLQLLGQKLRHEGDLYWRTAKVHVGQLQLVTITAPFLLDEVAHSAGQPDLSIGHAAMAQAANANSATAKEVIGIEDRAIGTAGKVVLLTVCALSS